MRTRGDGVKKSNNFVDIINGSPLTVPNFKPSGKNERETTAFPCKMGIGSGGAAAKSA